MWGAHARARACVRARVCVCACALARPSFSYLFARSFSLRHVFNLNKYNTHSANTLKNFFFSPLIYNFYSTIKNVRLNTPSLLSSRKTNKQNKNSGQYSKTQWSSTERQLCTSTDNVSPGHYSVEYLPRLGDKPNATLCREFKRTAGRQMQRKGNQYHE